MLVRQRGCTCRPLTLTSTCRTRMLRPFPHAASITAARFSIAAPSLSASGGATATATATATAPVPPRRAAHFSSPPSLTTLSMDSMDSADATDAAARRIDGTAVAKAIRESIRDEIAAAREKDPRFAPRLVIFQVGERADSDVYVRMKMRAAAE
ncbi:tetrahydrofolate synthase, partial [Ascosphaera acerosa]